MAACRPRCRLCRWLTGAKPDQLLQVLPDIPEAWLQALQQLCSAIGEHMSEHPTLVEPDLQSFYFSCLQMSKLADSFGAHSLFDWTPGGDPRLSTLCIRNVLPAPFLRPRLGHLPGQRLIGAFIATLGLPQVNAVNEHFKRRLDDMVGDGHAFTYLYPGLQKVVQAAGRVIRTTTDQGVVHLLDDRYLRSDIRALLPGWWAVGGSVKA